MSSHLASAKKRTLITYGKSARKRFSDYSPATYKFADDEDELNVPSGVGLVTTPGSKRMVRRKSVEHDEVEQDVEMALDMDHHSSPVVSMVQSIRARTNGSRKIKTEPFDDSVYEFPASDEDIPTTPNTPMRPILKRLNSKSNRTKTPISAKKGTVQTDAGTKGKPNGNGRRVRTGLPTTPATEPTSRTYRITKPAPPTIVRSKSMKESGHATREGRDLVEGGGSAKGGSSSSEKVVRKGILKNGGTTSTSLRTRVTRSMSAQLEDEPDIVMGGMVFGDTPSEHKKTTKRTYARKEVQTTTTTSDQRVVPETPVSHSKPAGTRPSLKKSASCFGEKGGDGVARTEQRGTTDAITMAIPHKAAAQSGADEIRIVVERPETTKKSPNPPIIERRKVPTPLPIPARESQRASSPDSNASSPGTKRSHMEFSLDASFIPDPEPTPRKRIVDRLKMNASMHSVHFSDDSDLSGDDDTSMDESSSQTSPIRPDSQLAAAIAELSQNSQTSQPESQKSLPLDKDGVVHRQRIGPKITYSRQRSFLTEDVEEDAIFDRGVLPSALRALAVKETEPEEEEFSSDDEDSQGKAVKSLHELRETGVNQRYIDEVEGLFDDIENELLPISAKRSGFMELARKMLNKNYVHKFSTNGFDHRILASIGEVKDHIISFAQFSILISLLIHEPTSQTAVQIRSDKILRMLCSGINNTKDIKAIAKERASNMSKAGISLVGELADEIIKAYSPIFSHPPKFISLRLLSAKVLERLTHRLRLLDIKDEFLPADTTWSMISFLTPFGDADKAFSTYQSMDRNFLTIPINFLRAYAASEMTFLSTSSDLSGIATLSSIFIHLKSHLAKDDPKTLHTLKELLFIFTNRNARTAEHLAQTNLVSALVGEIDSGMKEIENEEDLDKRQAKADDVVQTIGTLCGLAQNSGAARDAVLLTWDAHKRDDWDVDMDGDVGEKKTHLDVLLGIFNQYYSEEIFTIDNMSQIYIIIVLGYLSILLGTLAQHPKARLRLTSSSSSYSSTLTSLAKVIEEFIRVNKVMDKLFEQHPEMVNSDDGWKGGLNGKEGGRQLEGYQELRDRLLLWNRV